MVKKGAFVAFTGFVGTTIAELLGGWDAPAQTLVLFMTVDYLSGVIVAGVFHKSSKSDDGALNSRAGFKGLFKKCVILFMVLIAHRLDITFGTDMIRNTVIIGYICNEGLSIVENAGLMGVPVPKVLLDSIEVLKKND